MKRVDVLQRTVLIQDEYSHVSDVLGDSTVNDVIETAIELSKQYISKVKKENPLTYVYPRKQGVDRENWGFRYLLKRVPRLLVWCQENVAGTLVKTLYTPEDAVLRDGKGLGAEGTRLLQKLPDAVGVRARAQFGLMRLSRYARSGEHWLSAPSGNNLPILMALKTLPNERHPEQVTLIDYSFSDLRTSRDLAETMDLGGVKQKYLWRNLVDEKGFIKRQRLSKFLAPFMLRQLPIRGDHDLEIDSVDRTRVDGWAMYWTDDALARHIKEHLSLIKPGGELMFDEMRETHPHLDFTRLVLGWRPFNTRNLDQLHDKVLSPNADLIDFVTCFNVSSTERVVVVTKK